MDGFRDVEQMTRFNGMPALVLDIFAVGNETPTLVAATAKEFISGHEDQLPEGTSLAIWDDASESFSDRIDLLTTNALLGLGLVLIVLGLFLEFRLAFWVALGIPISFLGAFIFLPLMGVSLNMISMFAFLLTLGIVVDDAIVVGEAIHNRRSEGHSPSRAALLGIKDVATPVTFSVLTTIAVFVPLLFVPGTLGKFFGVIPVVVIIVLFISLVESLLILPAHLSHGGARPRDEPGRLALLQRRFSKGFEATSQRYIGPLVRTAINNRAIMIVSGLAVLALTAGGLAGGKIGIAFMPSIESNVVRAEVRMPYGTPFSETLLAEAQIRRAAESVLQEVGNDKSLGLLSLLGSTTTASAKGGHVAEVSILLVGPQHRSFTAEAFAKKWRVQTGSVTGAESFQIEFEQGIGAGADVTIELSHGDPIALDAASRELSRDLRAYSGVSNVDDGVRLGKQQLNFRLRPSARALGVTENELASQIRNAFFGVQALRLLRGRDEVRVYVRLPRSERRSVADIESLMITTPKGGEVPFELAASTERARAYSDISRRNRRRISTVAVRLDTSHTSSSQIEQALKSSILPRLMRNYPGLAISEAGQQAQQTEATAALANGFSIALLAMFSLLAIPLRSYIQPLIIMMAIPFGVVGGILGHLLMGYDLGIMSMMGMIAASGVVVNDSLILLSTANKYRASGAPPAEAVIKAAIRRFRPIVLTSITTFLGLAPMILETSPQARFLIPMALSLGFGVLAATGAIVVLVPVLYMIVNDLTPPRSTTP